MLLRLLSSVARACKLVKKLQTTWTGSSQSQQWQTFGLGTFWDYSELRFDWSRSKIFWIFQKSSKLSQNSSKLFQNSLKLSEIVQNILKTFRIVQKLLIESKKSLNLFKKHSESSKSLNQTVPHTGGCLERSITCILPLSESFS